jgi:hypothetical protein
MVIRLLPGEEMVNTTVVFPAATLTVSAAVPPDAAECRGRFKINIPGIAGLILNKGAFGILCILRRECGGLMNGRGKPGGVIAMPGGKLLNRKSL